MRAISAQPWAGPLLLVGTSEGADVAAAIAAREPKLPISALLLIGGAGPSQFFDLATLQREAQSREGVAKVFADYLSFLDGKPPADLLVIELMRQQKQRAIYYWSVAGTDHSLSDARGNHLAKIIEVFATWANSAPTGRTIVTRAP